MYIYIYVCMCVWNIWRDVKLLSCTWFFAWGSILSLVFNLKSTKVSNLNFSRGQWISFHPLPNEDGGLRLWYRDRSSRHTCNFPIFRQWQPAKPRTGMSVFSIFQHFQPNIQLDVSTVSAICQGSQFASNQGYGEVLFWLLLESSL